MLESDNVVASEDQEPKHVRVLGQCLSEVSFARANSLRKERTLKTSTLVRMCTSNKKRQLFFQRGWSGVSQSGRREGEVALVPLRILIEVNESLAIDGGLICWHTPDIPPTRW